MASDIDFMRLAIDEALQAQARGEVPVARCWCAATR